MIEIYRSIILLLNQVEASGKLNHALLYNAIDTLEQLCSTIGIKEETSLLGAIIPLEEENTTKGEIQNGK